MGNSNFFPFILRTSLIFDGTLVSQLINVSNFYHEYVHSSIQQASYKIYELNIDKSIVKKFLVIFYLPPWSTVSEC